MVLPAVLIGLVAESARAKDPWERPWLEVRTPHFRIKSAISESRTHDLARDLENFRRAALVLTNVGRAEERIPTHLYLFPSAVPELGFRNHIAGYFIPQMRANYAAAIAQGSAADEILKHEYVHFLIHNRDHLSYPAWFDEGFAEVLATLRVKDLTLEYGKPMPERVSWLMNGMWLPFTSILEASSSQDYKGERGAMFYAQSWLLMHYLLVGREGASFGVEAREFLRLSEEGAKPASAFEQAFGIDPRRLRTTLIRYGSKLKYTRATLRQPFPEVGITTSPVSKDVIAAELGLLCLIQGDAECAERYWDAALRANPKNGMALVGKGDVLKFKDRFAEAEPYYLAAISHEPESPLHELDYAEYFVTRAQAAKDPERAREDWAEARRHFARSYALDPENPETLAMNGETYLRDGESAELALSSLQAAHDLLPSQWQIKLLLAEAHAKAGQKPEAIALLRSLAAYTHGDLGEQAQKRIAELAASDEAAEPEVDGESVAAEAGAATP